MWHYEMLIFHNAYMETSITGPSAEAISSTVTNQSPKHSATKTVLTIVGIIILVAAIGIGAFLVGQNSLQDQKIDDKQNLQNNNEDEDVDQNEIGQNDNPIAENNSGNQQYPAYTLNTLQGSISVPAGWRVSKVDHIFKYLTQAQMTQWIKSESGAWPITEYGTIAFTKVNSVIEIKKNAIFVEGGFGGTTPGLQPNATVVVAPQGQYEDQNSPRTTLGTGRVLTNGTYKYYVIFTNEYYNPEIGDEYEGGNQYNIYSSNLNNRCNVEFTFTGAQADLATADTLFESAIRANSSKWCE